MNAYLSVRIARLWLWRFGPLAAMSMSSYLVQTSVMAETQGFDILAALRRADSFSVQAIYGWPDLASNGLE